MVKKVIECPTCGASHTRERASVEEVREFLKRGGFINGTSSSILEGTYYYISDKDWLFGGSKSLKVDEDVMRKHFYKEVNEYESEI